MANYYFPTVVQPSIPATAMTPLEHLILCEMFEFEVDGDAFYFFAQEGSASTVSLDIQELKAHLDDSPSPSGPLVDHIREQLEAVEDDSGTIDLDLSDFGEGILFQDIVRRHADLDHVTIISAWTCDKMRPDGFGGSITVVTADHVLAANTARSEGELLDRAEYGELGRAPGYGSHVLLRLDEKKVRESIDAIIGAGLPSALDATAVTDQDIRAACAKAAEAADLAAQHEALLAIVARGAIAIARERTA